VRAGCARPRRGAPTPRGRATVSPRAPPHSRRAPRAAARAAPGEAFFARCVTAQRTRLQDAFLVAARRLGLRPLPVADSAGSTARIGGNDTLPTGEKPAIPGTDVPESARASLARPLL
jgi:hypothetical protein